MSQTNTPANYTGRADVEKIFDSYDPSHPEAITFGTVLKMAADRGYRKTRKFEGAPHLGPLEIQSTSLRTRAAMFELSDGAVSVLDVPPRKREYILGAAVVAGTYNVLAGSGGTSKTIFLMTTAAAMAQGQCLGDFQITSGASMLFLGEEDQNEVSRRLSGICAHYGYDPLKIENFIKAFPAAGVDLRLTRNVNGSIEASSLGENVVDLAKQHSQTCGAPVRLIVFDHARLVMDGDPDDAAHVTQLTRALTYIAQATEAAVMLLAHSPKKVLQQQAAEMSVADVAGSSAFSDNARSGFIMYGMRLDDAKALQISEGDRAKYVKLVCAKANYGPQGTEWWFEKVTLDEWQVQILQPVSLQKPMFRPGQAKQQLRQRILTHLANKPGRSKRQLRDMAGRARSLGASEKEVTTATDDLIEAGLVELRKPSPAEYVTYRLARGRELLFAAPSQT